MNKQDTAIRHEAAMMWSRGESRKAITTLIERINSSNGHCDAKIWLCVLDLYHIEHQQAAYEKLAVFFSNRFHFSPPSWENEQGKKPKQAGQWRNALIVEGSPLDIHEEKIRDFLRASKEAKESRIDFSRMRLDDDETVMDVEIKKLLDIMQRLRRTKAKTLLMGEAELLETLQKNVAMVPDTIEPQDNGLIQDMPHGMSWMMIFEILQWRGREEEFNKMAIEFAEKYNLCPIGYDHEMAIAVSPIVQHEDEHVYTDAPIQDTMLDATPLLHYIETQWNDSAVIEMDFSKVKRMSYECAHDLVGYLQAHDYTQQDLSRDSSKEEQSNGQSGPVVIIREVNEIVGSLLELAGVTAYCRVEYRYAKLRDLLEM